LPLGYLEYAEAARHQIAEIQDPTTPCGIIRVAALCDLCRYRHNSHWTGHASRLDRNLKNRFGSAAYAAEELVAELSSAMIGAELGLPVTHLDSHASYIEHWLKLLKQDDRAILTAAAKAEEASSLLLKLGGRITADDSLTKRPATLR
jgi:antirestriction protein ArdC